MGKMDYPTLFINSLILELFKFYHFKNILSKEIHT